MLRRPALHLLSFNRGTSGNNISPTFTKFSNVQKRLRVQGRKRFKITILFLVLLARTLPHAMNQYTIDQIETAINYWREHEASGDDAALCPRARTLADVYGLMIYRRANKVAANTLTPEQNDALNLALSQAVLPL